MSEFKICIKHLAMSTTATKRIIKREFHSWECKNASGLSIEAELLEFLLWRWAAFLPSRIGKAYARMHAVYFVSHFVCVCLSCYAMSITFHLSAYLPIYFPWTLMKSNITTIIVYENYHAYENQSIWSALIIFVMRFFCFASLSARVARPNGNSSTSTKPPAVILLCVCQMRVPTRTIIKH